MSSPPVVVLAPMTPDSIPLDKSGTTPLLSEEEKSADALDTFNRPRFRRALILKTLEAQIENVAFQIPPGSERDLTKVYANVHSVGLLSFLTTVWSRWDALGEDGQDPGSSLDLGQEGTKPLIPINTPLPRDPYQRSPSNVMGEIGFYCTDMCTPIMKPLLEELQMDSAIVQAAVDKAVDGEFVYAIPTHPGHHAAKDSFGGYCYLNQAAFAARLFQTKHKLHKVAVLDIGERKSKAAAACAIVNMCLAPPLTVFLFRLSLWQWNCVHIL